MAVFGAKFFYIKTKKPKLPQTLPAGVFLLTIGIKYDIIIDRYTDCYTMLNIAESCT